ncbi:MAG: RsmB/NOP family class I SAM-dependent RNA methyltransferase, partial [Gemmatimonadales bacterium]
TGLAERDRRLAYALAAGTLRRQAELDRELDLSRADPRLHDILRLGAFQLRALTRVPTHAAVSTSVALARETAGEKAAGYVNQALRKLVGAGGVEPRAGATHPEWLVRRWRNRFGAADTERLIAWNDTRPMLTLQPVRWDMETLTRRLEDAGIEVTPAPFEAGLRLAPGRPTSHTPHPTQLPGFEEGGFLVQDTAQALVCRFAAIPPGARVYDACAAPGGKAVQLEAAGARVVAGDARRDRLDRLAETVRRCGVAIRVVLADLLAAPLEAAAVDAVLLDAPCTATGTMARHPDARWRLTPGAIARAAARQRRLFDAAARLVRPGGLLVYATCSLEPEENADVVDQFLRRHPAFAREPRDGAVPAALMSAAGDFQTTPQRHGVDGAYAARLRRARKTA